MPGYGGPDGADLHTPSDPWDPDASPVTVKNGERTGLRVGPVTVRLSDVPAESVDWLWPGRLPLGKLVILDGDPALGKSTMALDFAARLSTGARWPDGAPCPTAATVIMSAEDGLADTIRPRIDAAGADPSNVYALTEVRYRDDAGEARTRLPSLADMPSIEAAVKRTTARLLVIDVLMAFLGGGVDSHRDQDVRSVLHGLAAVAERSGCCVLLLRHLNKSGAGAAMYRGGGSIGIIGAARAGFVVAADPDDESRRIFAPLKSNLAAAPDALAYRLVSAGEVARVQWDGPVAHSAGDLLGRREGDEDRTERDEAVQWLMDCLTEKGGEMAAADLLRAGNRDGLGKDTLKRAKHRAGVISVKDGFGGGWTWRLLAVEERTNGAKGAAPENPLPSPPSATPVRPSGVTCGITGGANAPDLTHPPYIRLVQDRLGGQIISDNGAAS